MSKNKTQIDPVVFAYWQNEAHRLRGHRNELRDLIAELRGMMDMDIPTLKQIARALPPSRELTLLRALIARWEAKQARMSAPHQESEDTQ